MIEVDEIIELHAHTVALWHEQEISNPYAGFLQLVCQQHSFNFLLWHEEDIARSPDAGDARIAAVKRAIDGYNQKRNDGIEKLDASNSPSNSSGRRPSWSASAGAWASTFASSSASGGRASSRRKKFTPLESRSTMSPSRFSA